MHKQLKLKSLPIMKKLLLLLSFLASSSVFAQKIPTNILYVGSGVSVDKSVFATKDRPYSIGYISTYEDSSAVWGIDLAQEGTELNSTWGQKNSITSGTSINLLIGRNISQDQNYRLDVALLAGARSKSQECPKSYLGFQCYADAKPDVSYAFNYGAVIALSYKNFTIGTRLTAESRQLLLGFRF